jgi:Ca2+-dependent lipid-binding protein
MPGRVKVRVVAGRNLPVMDRTNETTDAYVEVRFGSTTYKTEVCRKSLCPQWNSEWFRFEVRNLQPSSKTIYFISPSLAVSFVTIKAIAEYSPLGNGQ